MSERIARARRTVSFYRAHVDVKERELAIARRSLARAEEDLARAIAGD